MSALLEHTHKDTQLTIEHHSSAALLCRGLSLLWQGAGVKWPPVSVPHPATFHVDPTLQMSHGLASSCSGFALKSLMGERQEGRERLRVCVGVWEHAINFALLSFFSVLLHECARLLVDNGQSLSCVVVKCCSPGQNPLL